MTAFVEAVIAPLYASYGAVGWWDHHGAVVRLEATWKACEADRRDEAQGISRWLREVAVVQLDRLRDRGPRACGPDKRPVPSSLPTEPR